MPLFWLRVALVFYGFGLIYALLMLSRRRELSSQVVLPVAGLGLVFHFVALAEELLLSGHLAPATAHQVESLLAFLLMLFFLGVYWRYRTASPGALVFPLVLLLTFFAALGEQPPEFSTPLLRSGWVLLHIALIFAGYAALFFSFAASILYLAQERSLKAKHSAGIWARLPALETIDDIGYRSLLLGFPFMTAGLLAGSVLAGASFGAAYFRDPKVVLSVLMWLVYMVLLYTRWNAGWRGRRAAFLSTFAFLAALGAWAANYLSAVHHYVTP